MKIFKKITAAMALVLLASGHAGAQTNARYPNQAIRLVVPYVAGGSADIIGRILAQELEQSLGQPVIVDNKAGASTQIAAAFVAQSKPDGYTLLFAPNSTMVINPQLFKKMPYSTSELGGIGLVAISPLVLIVSASSPFNSVKDLIAAARSQPEKISFGSFGSGTTSHLFGELLNQSANIHMLHVPYKGAAPAMTDLIGGNISAMFDVLPSALAQIKSGKVKALAVPGAHRNPQLPTIPTMTESGVTGFGMDAWLALVGPAGMPQQVTQRLAEALASTSMKDSYKQKITSRGMDVPSDTSEAHLKRTMEVDSRIYKDLIEKAKITPE